MASSEVCSVCGPIKFVNPPTVVFQGSTSLITWLISNASSITLALKQGSQNTVGIVSDVAVNVRNTGSFAWNVPYNIPPAKNYLLLIVDSLGSSDVSPLFTLSAVNGGITSQSTASRSMSSTSSPMINLSSTKSTSLSSLSSNSITVSPVVQISTIASSNQTPATSSSTATTATSQTAVPTIQSIGSKGLSHKAIVGIIVGSIIGAAILLILIFLICCRRKKNSTLPNKSKSKYTSMTEPLTSPIVEHKRLPLSAHPMTAADLDADDKQLPIIPAVDAIRTRHSQYGYGDTIQNSSSFSIPSTFTIPANPNVGGESLTGSDSGPSSDYETSTRRVSSAKLTTVKEMV